jgi:hypothetical protein
MCFYCAYVSMWLNENLTEGFSLIVISCMMIDTKLWKS